MTTTLSSAELSAARERISKSFQQQALMAHLGATLGEVSLGETVIHLPYQAAITQQHGFLHAGAIASVVDSACGYAALSLMPTDAGVMSIEFKVNLLAPAKGQRFEAIGKVIKPGRTIIVCHGELIAIDGDSRKVVSTMTGTMMCLQGRGYAD